MTPTMMSQEARPAKLPFLEAICWQTNNVYRFTCEQMLSRYERDWQYRQVMAHIPQVAEPIFELNLKSL